MNMENVIKELEHVRQTDFDMSEPTKNAIDNVLELLKKEQAFRRVMFNRCATATMRVMDKNACGMCIFREDCEKERTVALW